MTIELKKFSEDADHYLESLQKGDEVIIEKEHVPFAKITVIPPVGDKRVFGQATGQIWMSDDFDDPISEEFLLGEE